MNRTIVSVLVASLVAVTAVFQADAATNAMVQTRQILITEVSTNATSQFLSMGFLKVEAKVVSTSTNETIRFSPKITLEFFDKQKAKVISSEGTWESSDGLSEVAPGKTGTFFCMSKPDRKLSGKGTIYVYATKEGFSGMDNRISNLIRMEVDFDQKTARVVDVHP